MWITSATSRLAMTGILFLFVADSRLDYKIFVKKLKFFCQNSKKLVNLKKIKANFSYNYNA